MTKIKLENNISDLRSSLGTSIKSGIEALEALTAQTDAVNLFIAAAANIILLASYHEAGTSYQAPPQLETLAFYLYPHFAESGQHVVTAFHSQACLNILDRLCAQQTMYELLPEEGQHDDGAMDIARRVRAYTENVRGSAYPEQTAEKILAVQGRFDEQFRNRIGLAPTRAQAILWGILEAHQRILDNMILEVRRAGSEGEKRWQEARRTTPKKRTPEQHDLLRTYGNGKDAGVWAYVEVLNRIAVSDFPVAREHIRGTDFPPSLEEWEVLIQMIGLTPADPLTMTHSVDVRPRPLYVMPDQRVVLADLSHALDVLWERYDLVARQDQQFHERYKKRKAKWLENNISECLQRIFPTSCVYQNLSYPDLDSAKPTGAQTELDVAVAWGPFLILVEGKAKQFRLESQLGNVARLSTDLATNIQDAFEQGRRAVRYIEAVDSQSSPKLKLAENL